MYKKHKAIIIACILLSVFVLSVAFVWHSLDHKIASAVSSKNRPLSWAQRVKIDPQLEYPVTEVVDGDTIKTIIEGHNITIRMLGIDTPEVVDPRKPVQCYGKEASEETKSLLKGKSVSIEINPNYDRVDKYGRLLAYIYVANSTSGVASTSIFLNQYLVQNGYAREYTYDQKKPYSYQKLFQTAESKAKDEKLGLWGACDH